MHKFFSKPQFFGKKVQFLPECHSTNEELAFLAEKHEEPEGFVVYTDYQTKGKGQRGNTWVAESGKNLLLSMLLKPHFIHPSEHFLLNVVTALAVKDAIGYFNPDLNVKLKWPNDVYIGEKKVCGILIEGTVKGEQLTHSIVGIGVNLNQKGFNVPHATSMLLESGGRMYERDAFMNMLLLQLEFRYLRIENKGKKELKDAYCENLMGYNEVRTFEDKEGVFTGIVRGIDKGGRLLVEKNEGLARYGLKEISFLGV